MYVETKLPSRGGSPAPEEEIMNAILSEVKTERASLKTISHIIKRE
jgi:hypothetical protein